MYQEEAHYDIESLVPFASSTTEDGAQTAVDITRLQAKEGIPNIDVNSMPESTNIEDRRGEAKSQARLTGQGGRLPFGASQEGSTDAPEGRSLTDVLFGPNRHITWPEHALRSIVGAMKLPGDVYQGNVDINSPEGLEKATDLALTTMTGGIGGVAKEGAKAAPKAALHEFMAKYFEKFPAEIRSSPKGKSHPGFRFQVIDDDIAKTTVAKESPKEQDNIFRAMTQAKLLNEYHGTDRFTLNVYPAKKLTAGEEKLLKEHGFLDDYLKAIKPPERSTVLGSGPIKPGPIEKSGYADVPDSLMGFRRNGPSRGFNESNFKHVQDVKVTMPSGDIFEDSIKGLNKAHALERARRNWPEATIKAINNTK